ncbi:MAG: glycosyltransferase [Candidatus Bipolaricaulia bacterium]
MKISDYEKVVGAGKVEELKSLAERLQGTSLLHVNSTLTGGGVAEMLHSLVPLFNDLGIKTRWEVIKGSPLFFRATKSIHNALQGNGVEIPEEMLERYQQINQRNAETLDLNSDIVVIHDPQPLSLIDNRPPGKCRWIWRCHIDISQPDKEIWKFLYQYIEKYDMVVLSMPEFTKYFPIPQDIIPPSIDPLSEKNKELPKKKIDEVYEKYGVPRDKPILLQVSRFDPFKDPIGVIEAYELVKREVDCRLVFAGGIASDDPESSEMLARVRERAQDDPDIHIIAPQAEPLPAVEVNALQRGADIIIQKSLREGFALTVTEAMWKGKPVVGTAVGGIKLQVIDGITGFLVRSIEETAERICFLLRNPELAQEVGEMAQEQVRRNFLITRHLRDYLRLFSIITP